jgi:hypothetical protein
LSIDLASPLLKGCSQQRSAGVCCAWLRGTEAERACCPVGPFTAPPTLSEKGDEMQLVLLAIAVWFGLELLLMAALFALAATEDRRRARNALLADAIPSTEQTTVD